MLVGFSVIVFCSGKIILGAFCFSLSTNSNKIEGDLIDNIELKEPDHVLDNHPDDRVELLRTRARRQAREIAC